MQLKHKANVVAPDGSRIGRLARVVLEPESGEVLGIVVRKGLGRSEEKVVAVSLIQAADSDEIRLRGDVRDPGQLPPFEKKLYVPSNDAGSPRGTPAIDFLTPAHTFPAMDADRRPYRLRTEENIPPDSVPLKAGARVLDKAGDAVGSVEQVLTSAQQDRATHLVVAQGLFRKELKLVPMAWVEEVEREAVRLGVDVRQIERLRRYES